MRKLGLCTQNTSVKTPDYEYYQDNYIVSISVHKGTVPHYYHVLSMSAYPYVVISRNIIGTFSVIVCINYCSNRYNCTKPSGKNILD